MNIIKWYNINEVLLMENHEKLTNRKIQAKNTHDKV